MGRSASGVTGMRLRGGDKVMAMDVVPFELTDFDSTSNVHRGPDMLVVLENGFGKRTMLRNFHLQKRGGMGIRAANCTPKTGNFIGMHISYNDKGDVILASRKGQFIRMELTKIKRLGRDTQGVTLMKMREGDKVASVALIMPDETDHNGDQSKIPLDGNLPGKSPAIDSIPENHTKYDKKISEKAKKPDEGNSKIKVNYYEKNNMNEQIIESKETTPVQAGKNLPEIREEILPQVPANILPSAEPEIKVKNYKDDQVSEVSKEDIPKNPPIKKNEVNYWGGDKK
jgi:hypothetical protein